MQLRHHFTESLKKGEDVLSNLLYQHESIVFVYGLAFLLLIAFVVLLIYSRTLLERRILARTEDLRKSEARLSKAELVAGFGNWEFHLSDNRVVASDGARRLYGLGGSDWTITEVLRIPLPEYQPMLDEAMKKLIRENRPFDKEFKICRPSDGEVRDIHSIAEYDPFRHVVFGVLQDNTEQKRTEENLRRSEERYRVILDNMEEAYYELDLRGNMMFFSGITIKSLGYTNEEMQGMNFSQYADPGCMQHVIDVFSKIYLTGETIKGFEWLIIGKHGRSIPVETSASLVRDSEGNPVGFRGITRDATWRKEAQEALHRSKERYRTIFENTGTATVLSSEDTTVLLANSNFEILTGYSKEEMEGKMSWTAFVSEEDLERMKNYHMQRRQEGEPAPKSYEARCKNRSGEFRDMFLTVALIPGTKESVISCLDMTDHNRAEEEMRRSEKLQGVLEMAGAVCHELNQPLQVLMSSFDLLATDAHAAELDNELLGSVQTGIEQIGSLTQKIMKITEYEVKDYMGGKSKIIDIDRSSSVDL